MAVLVETTLGDFVVDLFYEERPSPARNFLKLCKSKYYNLNQFFTIQKDYIAQTGDPTSTGRGGESIFMHLYGEQARYFTNESTVKMKHRRRGTVSFVNNGAGLYGSQFFITLADDLDYLDGKHCIFGIINEGLETVDALNATLVNDANEPFKDIRIAHTHILDDPFPDDGRLTFPERSPSPTPALIDISNKIALDQELNEDAGKSADVIQREIRDRDIKNSAQILEMIGDLHNIDERPPDNVLFVCKLNPATTDEDLEVIFGRFGDIIKCEVIRDRRTQLSLQYAFIEFGTPQQCDAAYLKMDNVLIDDRRIHVDFSQSVAKNYQWKTRDEKVADRAPDKNRERDRERENGGRNRPGDAQPKRRSRSPPHARDSHSYRGSHSHKHKSKSHKCSRSPSPKRRH